MAPRLFDLEADPLELNDLAASKPDVVAQYDAMLQQVCKIAFCALYFQIILFFFFFFFFYF